MELLAFVIDVTAISAVARIHAPRSVEDIFTIERSERNICVLVIAAMIRVIRIRAVLRKERHAWSFVLEFCELLEERSREIEILSRIRHIPSVTPPATETIHLVWFLGRINRHRTPLA